MAEVVRYVDPDASGAGDGTSWTDAYTSLSAWSTTEATDLVTAGDWHHVYCRSSAGGTDTDNAVIASYSGWETDSDHYILIEAAEGDEAKKDGIDTSRYRLHVTDTNGISGIDEYVTLYKLQLMLDCDTSNSALVEVDTGVVTVDSCYLKVDAAGTSSVIAYCIKDYSDNKLLVQNSAFNIISGTGEDYRYFGVDKRSSGDLVVYQNTIYGSGNGRGINVEGSVNLDAINNAVFGINDNFRDYTSGTFSIDHCASDDGDGTNSVSPSGSDWDNEFTDPANGDFTLLSTGNLYHGGTTISGGPTYDIDGDEWDASTPSIGVDEYVSAGGTTSVPVFVHHYAMMRK